MKRSLEKRKKRLCFPVVLLLISVLAAGAVLQGCGQPQGTNEAAGSATEKELSAAKEEITDEITVSGSPDIPAGEAKELPRLMDEDEESFAIEKVLAKTDQSRNEGDELLYPVAEAATQEKKHYTLMIYMVGSDLEASGGYATKDIDEIMDSGADLTDTNILIYTGGAKRWHSGISSAANSILDMSLPEDGRVVAQTEGNADMGAPDTLRSFLDFSAEYYPSDHYALIFWDHGGGSVYGFGSDTLYRGDSLLLDELDEAMRSSAFSGEQELRLDWVGFDACLMATLENAALWKNYADYLVASEETEPGDGWSYDFLETLNSSDDPALITSSIVRSYENYYKKKRTPLNDPDITLAAMDLRKTDKVVAAVDDLTQSMITELNEGNFPSLARTHASVKMFGVRSGDGRGSAYDLLDVNDMALKLEKSFPEQADAVRSAVSEMIIENTGEVKGSCGVSLYFPGENRELYAAAKDTGGEIRFISETFRKFSDLYAERWTAASDADWTIAKIQKGENEYTLQLTDEQVRNLGQASYTVLQEISEGSFRRAMCRVRLVPDENNILHIPADPELITPVTDTDQTYAPYAFVQTGDDGVQTYDSMQLVAARSGLLADYDSAADDNIVASLEMNEGKLSVKSFTYEETSGSIRGKNTVELSDYVFLYDMYSSSLFPTWNEDGSMKPYYAWDSGTVMGYYTQEIGNDLHFETRPASGFSEGAILQILLQDINGNDHASEYVTLKDETEIKVDTVTEKTPEDGVLTFRIDSENNAAFLTGYEGADTRLTIPSKVEGIPVKGIGNGAFGSSAEKLEEVSIPEGVETIECNAFHYAKELKRITLPSTLRGISTLPINNCGKLEAIEVREGASSVCSVSGVLFSKDRKKLLYCPSAIGDTYKIPDGTEEIVYGAFEGTSAGTIIFPESLKKIGNYAFFDAAGLESLSLPEHLEYIGDCAFDGYKYSIDDEEAPVLDNVYIGPDVSYIGGRAFSKLKIINFEVSGDNRAFSGVNGMIGTKTGDMLLCCPGEAGGMIVVPDGVAALSKGVFFELDPTACFVLPDTLNRIPGMTFPYDFDDNGDRLYRTKIICSKGSAAETYAAKNEIPYETPENIEQMITDSAYTVRIIPGISGTARYHLYNDHAVFVQYRGGKSTVVLPERVDGLPVTEVGNGADPVFSEIMNRDHIIGAGVNREEYSPEALDEIYHTSSSWGIVFPDSVKTINDGALGGIYETMDVLELPAELETLADNAIGKDLNIREFRISEENKNYRTADGILYSSDMKKLIRFPSGIPYPSESAKVSKEGETVSFTYSIPEGVEEIGRYAFSNFGASAYEQRYTLIMPSTLKNIGTRAFYGASLQSLRMNEGLKTIDKEAFYQAHLAEDGLILPDSVEKIGDGAFKLVTRNNDDGSGSEYGFKEIHLPDSLEEIGEEAFDAFDEESIKCSPLNVGRRLKQIAPKAFAGINTESIIVDAANDHYCSKDGMLLDKDEKTLAEVPCGMNGELHIPEGVTAIDRFAIYNCVKITDIYIPDSVISIDKNAVYYSYSLRDSISVRIHCSEDSHAAAYADLMGFDREE